MSETHPGTNNDPITTAAAAVDLVTKAVQDGAADASQAAARTWSATSRFTSRFVYTTFYTISYGVVFPSVLLARSIPRDNAAVRGLIEGAHAAAQKVDQLKVPALAGPSATSPKTSRCTSASRR